MGGTTTAVHSPVTSANLVIWPASAITCRTCPAQIRSSRSAGCSSVEAGMITAPSFIAASMTSHSGTMLPSISSTWSPRRTPRPRSQLATCEDLADMAA